MGNQELIEGDDNACTINFGWDSVKVYANVNGDICFGQHSPVFAEDVIICVPRLYADQLKWHIDRALRESEDEN